MATGRIFLSHAGEDAAIVRELAIGLKQANLDVWLDLLELKPGDDWTTLLQTAIAECDAFAVYVGRTGIQKWTDIEVRAALSRHAADPSFRIIPILGSGASHELLPPFLRLHQWITWPDSAAGGGVAALAEALRSGTPKADCAPTLDRSPYLGLASFDVGDSHLFFGRDQEIAALLAKFAAGPLLSVIGASGTGKSSLVRAGLVPSLHRGRLGNDRASSSTWAVAIMRPADAPFRELGNALLNLNPDLPAAQRIEVRRQLHAGLESPDGLYDAIVALVPAGRDVRALLVVDQFEELFTLNADGRVRERFIDAVLGVTDHYRSDCPVNVVFTLRADFVDRLWEHQGLLDRAFASSYPVGRLAPAQLREMIERPLAFAGGTVEPGLTDVLLEDMGNTLGGLTLLEHALLELWERRRGSTLTHDAYGQIGRLRGAIARRAEDLYRSLDPQQQNIARRIFLQLVNVGEGPEHTRRRARKSDILSLPMDVSEPVLEQLIQARLLTANREPGGDDTVEVTHEAVIDNWPALRGWVESERDALRFERRLSEAAAQWRADDRDAGYLYRGRQLALAENWLIQHQHEAVVTIEQREFVEASIEARTGDALAAVSDRLLLEVRWPGRSVSAQDVRRAASEDVTDPIVPIILLTSTRAEFESLVSGPSPQIDVDHSQFGGRTIDGLIARYGELRGDWRPIGAVTRIAEYLKDLEREVNSMFRKCIFHPVSATDADGKASREAIELVERRPLSLLVVDPLSLYHPWSSDVFRQLGYRETPQVVSLVFAPALLRPQVRTHVERTMENRLTVSGLDRPEHDLVKLIGALMNRPPHPAPSPDRLKSMMPLRFGPRIHPPPMP